MVNAYLTDFEHATGLSPKEVATVLGTAYSTYMLYRSTRRALPPYIRAHIRTLLALPAGVRQPIVDARRGK